MATNNDPDETSVMDLVIARHRIAALFDRDGRDADEQAALDALDAPIVFISRRTRTWLAVLSFMRNGLTRHTSTKAKDADITIVVNPEHQMIDLLCPDCIAA
ncbi:MAG: hypothetical protein WBA46_09525 [Thermomicrobiales bacterium]